MRSLFVIAANLAALRFEVTDFQYSCSKKGLSPDELKKVADAINAIGFAETQLKAFRFITKVADGTPAPETPSKPAKQLKK